jgi:hypothetical protein
MITMKTRSPAVAVALAVLAGAMGTGCGMLPGSGGGNPQASADVVSGDGGGAVTTDPTTGVVSGTGGGAVDVAGLTLPRKVTYAGVEYTVTKVTPQIDKEKGPGVGLDVTMRNTLPDEQSLYASHVSLREPDGSRLQAEGSNDPANPGYLTDKAIYLASGAKEQRTVFVPVTRPLRVADTRFSVANTDKKGVPAEVPLSGPEPKPQFPIDLTLPTDSPTFPGRPGFTVKLRSAQLVEEWGDVRAQIGTHLIVMKIAVIAGTCDYCSGSGAGSSTVRVVVDGTPKQAEYQDPSGCCLIDMGQAVDLTEVYVMPDRYTSVSLVVQGNNLSDNPPQHPLPFTIPPLPTATGSSTTGSVPSTAKAGS